MKKFALYLLIVLLGVAVLDGLNRLAIETAYAHLPENSELMRNNWYIKSCDAELVILGASRGVYDYNAVMLEDSLKMSCHSISIEGLSVISQYFTLKKAIAGGKTKMVIFDISIAQLSDDWVEDQTSVYYPFYWKNEDVRAFINEQQGLKMSYLLKSSFIQYNSTMYDLLYTGFVRKSKDRNGYIALTYTGVPFEYDPTDDSQRMQINSTAELYLQKIVDLCKENNIRLVICDGPRLGYINQSIDDYLKRITTKNQVEFLNFSNYPPIISDLRLFVDPVHVNERGADIFTRALIDSLKANVAIGI